MNKDKSWMLITYYCPIHGDIGRMEPIEITKTELGKNFLEQEKPQKKVHKTKYD